MSANCRSVFVLFFLMMSYLTLAACSSATDSAKLEDVSADVKSPQIFSNFPAAGDVEIETDQVFRVTFTELMDIESLIASISITEEAVEIDGGSTEFIEVPVSVSVSDTVVASDDPLTGQPINVIATQVEIVPTSGRLTMNSRVQVRISEKAKDLSTNESIDPITSDQTTGNFLAGEFVARYDTMPGKWGAVSGNVLSGGVQDFYAQDINLLSTGAPVAAWAHSSLSAGADTIIVSAYDPSLDRWYGPASAVGTYDSLPPVTNEVGDLQVSGPVFHPTVTAGEDGILLVVWKQKRIDSNTFGVFYNFFDGTSWLARSSEVSNSSMLFSSTFPKVVGLGSKDFLIAWSQEDAVGESLNYRLFLPEATENLGAIATVPGSENDVVRDVELVSYAENVRVFWLAEDSSDVGLYTAIFSTASGFDSVSPVSFDSSPSRRSLGDVQEFHAAMNDNGDGYVAWSQRDGVRSDLFKAALQNDGVGVPEYVESDDRGDAGSPFVAVSKDGVFQIIWIQDQAVDDAVVLNRVMIASRMRESGWVSRNVGAHTGTSFSPVGVFDAQGNFYVFWDVTTNNAQQSLRYDAQTDVWENSGIIGARSGPALTSSAVPILKDGRMVLIQLVLTNGSYTPFSTLFDLPTIL